MLKADRIREIVDEVAKAYLKPTFVTEVRSEPAIDSEGHEALRITIIIGSDAARRLKGDAVLDTLVQIKDRLRDAGEDRLAMVEYATKEELESGGDP